MHGVARRLWDGRDQEQGSAESEEVCDGAKREMEGQVESERIVKAGWLRPWIQGKRPSAAGRGAARGWTRVDPRDLWDTFG